MRFYIFDPDGFEYGSYATMADAYEEMTKINMRFGGDLFITTNEDPWKNKRPWEKKEH